jgi:hypothetical protein
MAQQNQNSQNQSSQSSSQSGASGQGQSGSTGSTGSTGSGQSSGSGQSAGSTPQSGSSGGQGAAGDDPRVQQALDRLREADNDMARAASEAQNQADARRAADRLREATSLLGGTGKQAAAQQMDAIAQEANRLGNDQRDQSDRLKQLQGQLSPQGGAGQPGQSGQAGAGAGATKGQQQAQIAQERQQTAADLGDLEKQMQEAVRSLGASQQEAASKLRDALSGLDQSGLQNELQRSAQGIRRGNDPNADETERNVAQGMQRLQDQVRQAQQAVTGDEGSGTEQALNNVEQLRNQMEALSRGLGNQLSRNGQPGQGGQQGQAGNQAGGNQAGGNQAGGNQGGGNQAGGNQAGGLNGGANARGGNNGGAIGARNGQVGGGGAGPYFNGQLGFDGGGNWASGTETKEIPVTQADIQRAYDDAQRQLEQMRQQVQGQPAPLADIQDLLKQIQQLDPSRFPGNPAMLEELHNQMLASVDKLELQLRRDLDDKQAGQVRSGDSLPVPAGYQDSVADYFRRLSKNTPTR